MFEEAMYLAFEIDSGPLLNYIKILAKKQRNIIVETMIDHFREKTNPGSSSTTLLKSLT
jgi:hypothetical protein